MFYELSLHFFPLPVRTNVPALITVFRFRAAWEIVGSIYNLKAEGHPRTGRRGRRSLFLLFL